MLSCFMLGNQRNRLVNMTNDIITGDLRGLHAFIYTCRADGMLPADRLATVYKCEYCGVYPKSNTQEGINTILTKIELQGNPNVACLLVSYLD
jgi:hypothetical protein